MHITELRLAGFKSFVDGARAPIEPGLTGVVGPNGCGKSNLLEAVRWVMGAASAKSMRAADMDDVIFAGSAGRPAREHAEVTLIMADASGKAPEPFHKAETLEITRRIRRGLGSTYRLNGKEVRAKDVQLLFADAATGANSPALVRQGQISELINAKPENRRRILEDAAGVAGLHARRHEADLKLKAAETNLARLDEVLTEIEAQAQSLKKQARQAERYRGLAHTLRETEALLLYRRWSEARTQSAEAEARLREAERAQALAAQEASRAERLAEDAREALPPLRAEEAVASAVLRRLEGVRVGLERDLNEADNALARAVGDLTRIRDESERLSAHDADAEAALARLLQESQALGPDGDEAQIETLKAARAEEQMAATARQAAEADLERLAAEAAVRRARGETLRDALMSAEGAAERAAKRKGDVESSIAALPNDAALQAKSDAARTAADEAQRLSSDLRAKLSDAEAALKKAETDDEAAWAPYRAAESAFKSLDAEVKALEKLSPPEGAKFPPVMASIEVEAGYEGALAAALGDDLDASLHSEALARWSGADDAKAKLPNGAEPLAKFVNAPEALHARLSLCGLVDRKDGARLIKLAAPGVRLVSREGDLWRWDGFVRAGAAPQPAAARLEHKTRLTLARKELSAAEKKFSRANEAWEQAKTKRRDADAAARALRIEAPRLATKAADAARSLDLIDAELKRLGERRSELDAQLVQAAAEASAATAALTEAKAAQAESAVPQDDTPISQARARVDAARQAAARLSAEAAAIEREQNQRKTRRAAISAEAEQWTRRRADSAARLEALAQEIVQIDAQRKAAEEAPAKARDALSQLADQAAEAEARRKRASDKVAEAETAQRLAETETRAKEQAHSSAREQRAGAEVHLQAAASRLEDIAAHAQEQTGQAPDNLAGLAGALLTGALGTASIQEIERRFDKLKSERDAAGPVNLRADEELVEAEARLAGLTAEKNDVAGAITKLRTAITKLNNEGRARLLAAFEIVEGHFAQLFATLFEGGQAALKLTENDDPLNAGLEIYAQPPGKRLATLSLMSGGEQALTATALIFAVFLANPAPLCVLDEVDAPLDDANVDRFCRMLEEMRKLTTTRFIVITHNPVTMSRMDRLYGVTMQEQGVSQLVSVDLARAQAMVG